MKEYAINLKGNSKTAIPTTTSTKKTCPDTCPLKEKGCYAKYNFLGKYWQKLTDGEVENAHTWESLMRQIKALPKTQLWRHNQAGDLPHIDGVINFEMLRQLVAANGTRNGFTYTHHSMEHRQNQSMVKHANDDGFTINLSANTVDQADEYKALNIAPVVTLLPTDAPKVSHTPKGHKVVVCPAENTNKVTCANCGLCSDASRDFIIGFRAHGTAKKHTSLIATDAA